MVSSYSFGLSCSNFGHLVLATVSNFAEKLFYPTSFWSFCFVFLLCTNTLKPSSAVATYSVNVLFPANFDAGASGYDDVSISYTRGSVAAAATHVVAVSHYNPDIWREAGRINANDYVYSGNYRFTVDCNSTNGYVRLKLRAVKVLGITDENIGVNVKIRSINLNGNYTPLDVKGQENRSVGLLPMTVECNLFVGRLCI